MLGVLFSRDLLPWSSGPIKEGPENTRDSGFPIMDPGSLAVPKDATKILAPSLTAVPTAYHSAPSYSAGSATRELPAPFVISSGPVQMKPLESKLLFSFFVLPVTKLHSYAVGMSNRDAQPLV